MGASASQLVLCAKAGHLKGVVHALDKGVNVDGKGQQNETALHWAVRNRDETMIKTLLTEYRASPNVLDSVGRTPLLEAADSGDSSLVKLLLQHRANVDISDKYGKTPLEAAAIRGNQSIVELLLTAGADDEEVLDDRRISEEMRYFIRSFSPHQKCDVKNDSLRSLSW
ncbi:26S proteasome non-ATPase regulatory subunit 10 [Diplonema papillatum]|nr:26S proteasome non-ATPase regulatory subunit 10 [Diplonema papillatum]|eukprot:gene3238-5070_t